MAGFNGDSIWGDMERSFIDFTGGNYFRRDEGKNTMKSAGSGDEPD